MIAIFDFVAVTNLVILASVSSDPWRQVMQADHKQDNDVCVQLT